MDNFVISKIKEKNYPHEIELNKNFSLYSNTKPDTLLKGNFKYLFFGKINGYFDKGQFINR